MMRVAWLLVVLCVSLVVSVQVQAQPLFPHAESIESTVANADLVFIAKLLKFGEAERADGREVHNTTIEVEETLKIDLFTDEPYTKMQVSMPRSESVLADWQKRSCRLLVATNEYAPHATTVIELTRDGTQVLTADLKLLRDPEAVIASAREALRNMPAAVKRIHTFNLAVPRRVVAGTEWESYYGTGGHLTLGVPVDQRLEAKAVGALRSESYSQRVEAARALRYFKSDENIARVRMLLDDPESSLYQQEEGIEERYYGVRAEAYQTLKAWGVEVEKPVIRTRSKVRTPSR